MSGLNNKRYLDGDGLLKFWEICCANFPHKDGRGATGNWNIKAATAGIADEAIKLKTARKITIAGAVTGNADFDGSNDITISTGINHTHNKLHQKYTQNTRPESANITVAGDGTLSHFKATSNMTTAKPMDVGHILHFEWDNAGGYSSQLYIPVMSGANTKVFPQWRTTKSGNTTEWHDWDTFLTTGNYSTYALPISGGTLTGNLIAPKFIGELQGNAATASSATKLTTARSIYGNLFDGTENIIGSEKSIGFGSINAIDSDPNNWVNNYSLKLQSSNNAMTFMVDKTDNGRKAMIQVGHAANNYAKYLGELHLNPLGGKVIIGINGTTDPALVVIGNAVANEFYGNLKGNVTGNVTGNVSGSSGSCTGNAATASSAAKLTTARKLWGQNFNGEADVAGNISGVTAIYSNKPQDGSYNIFRIVPYLSSLLFQVASTDGKSKAGKLAVEGYEGEGLESLYFGSTLTKFSGNVAIGGTTASEKLEVHGNVKATKFIGALQGNADTATSMSSFTTASSGDATKRYVWMSWNDNSGKPAYTDKLTFQTSTNTLFSDNFAGALTGNATSADKLNTNAGSATKPIYFGDGIPKQCNDILDVSITGDADHAATADEAAKTAGTLTLKTPAETITFNGSANKTFEVTAANLGLTKAVLYLGKSTTTITDGGTEKPTIDGNVVNTLTAGNIVIDSSDSREYIWNGSKWEKFGLDGDGAAGNYKPIQQAVGDPTASGSSTTFIDTIAQDANGKITVTKKSVNFGGYKPIQTAVSSPTASGNDISFIDTIAQDANGKITVTKKTVRSATASQSGVVTTDAQTFAGAKTFNGGIIGNLTGNAATATKATQDSDGNAINTTYLKKSGGALSGNLYIDGDWTTDIGLYFREGGDDKYGFNFTYGDGDYFRLNTRNDSTTNTEVFKVHRGGTSVIFASTPYVGSTKVSLEGHTHSSINDSASGAATTFAYSKSGLNYDDYSWLAGWNGYELRAVNKSQFAQASHTHSYLPTSGATHSSTFTISEGGDLMLKAPSWSSNDPGDLAFYSGSGSELARIYYASSKILMRYGSSAASYEILTTNTGLPLTGGTVTGTITAANFITSSDKRLKTNIKPLPTNSKSLELNFYEFDYVNNDNHSAGHIAQEVKEVYPELVHGNESETEHLSIDYTGLHSIQIKALKDEVDTLKTENKELRERLEKLEALLEKLV